MHLMLGRQLRGDLHGGHKGHQGGAICGSLGANCDLGGQRSGVATIWGNIVAVAVTGNANVAAAAVRVVVVGVAAVAVEQHITGCWLQLEFVAAVG